MCGIFGSVTKNNYKLSTQESITRNKILRGLALAMEKRGEDSTGIAGINRDSLVVYKKAMPAHQFVYTDEFEETLSQNHKIVIGHTRLATIGEVSNRNAHPFTFGNITGVHNGHVSNYIETGNSDIEVDSEAVFYLLNKYDNDYKKAFSELRGDFALAWFDQRFPTKLHLVSESNPIKIIYVSAIKTYFFASEEYPLASIVGSHFPLDDKKIWSPEKSMVYTISTGGQVKKQAIAFKKYQTPSHVYSSVVDETSPHYELPDDDYDSPPETRYNYESLHGSKNPFNIKEDNIKIALDTITEVYADEVQIIIRGIEEKGCFYCGHCIELEKDKCCYLYSIGDKTEDKHIICLDCKNTSQISDTNLLLIDMTSYTDLVDEIEEYKDLKAYDEYLEKHKGEGKIAS